jgi:hypothetical protein
LESSKKKVENESVPQYFFGSGAEPGDSGMSF